MVKQVFYARRHSAPGKIFSFLAVLALFLIIPVLVYVADKRQTNSFSHAAPSTTLSFSQSKLQVNPGSSFSLDVILDPGSNDVFLTNLIIDYDASIVKPTVNGMLANTSVFPTTISGPSYNNCTGQQCSMSISLSVGNPTQAIQKATTIMTLNFQAVGKGLTTITFDQQTKVFSIASADQANENVLSTTTPVSLFVGTGSFPSTSDSPSPTATTNPSLSVCHFEKPIVCPQVCIAGQPCPPPCNPVWVCPNPSPTPTPLPPSMSRTHDSNADIEKELLGARQHIDAIETDLNLLANNKHMSVKDRLAVAQRANQSIGQVEQSIAKDEASLKPSPTPIPYSGSSVGVILNNFLTFLQNLFPHKK